MENKNVYGHLGQQIELEHVVWAFHTGQLVPPPSKYRLIFALLCGAEPEG